MGLEQIGLCSEEVVQAGCRKFVFISKNLKLIRLDEFKQKKRGKEDNWFKAQVLGFRY